MQPLRSALVVMLVALALSACGGRPQGLMRPVETAAEGATIVPLLVATTRRPIEDAGRLFTGERGRGRSFTAIDVSIPPGHKPGEVEWPSSYPGDPRIHVVTRRTEALDRDRFRRALREWLAKSRSRQVLVFVHGYNNSFDDAVYRFAQITADAGADVVPVLFTWPSRASLLAYPYDRESATMSRDALETVLADIAAEPAVRDVSVLAHSMGNWATLEALRQMGIRRGAVPAKIRDVMLAAPDVDVDLARAATVAMGPRRPRFTLFVSRDDRALAVSSRVWGGTTRLGAIDPSEEPYKTVLARYDIDAVDLTDVRGSDMLNHGKFADSNVVRAIGNRLATGQDVTTRGGGLGETIAGAVTGVATTVGTTAGAIVTAPIGLVDAEHAETTTRRLGALVGANQDDPANLAPLDAPTAPRRIERR